MGRFERLLAVAAAAACSAGAPAQSCPSELPQVAGTWETLPYQMPINPISATLLRDGRILIVAGSENDAYNNHPGADAYRAALWDPTGTDASSIQVHHLEYDVFCSGTAALPHGRVLIVGGTASYNSGEPRATFFDPATDRFVQAQTMSDGRWYATATALGDGRIMAFSGLNQAGTTSTRVELYSLDPAGAGWGAPISEPFTPPMYPRAFLLPNGSVFYSGHGAGVSNARGYIFDPATSAWSSSAATTRSRQHGTAVLLPLLPPSYTPKVMALGGGPSPATRTTEVIDLSAATPAWSSRADMSTGRIQLGAILLPNGKLFVEGGSMNNEAPDGPGRTAEIYDPASDVFTPAAQAAYARLYHSAALLLPDATVISMGSNPGDRGRYLGAIERYTPPYLYDASGKLVTTARPALTVAPAAPLAYNAPFQVGYTSTSPISSAVLVRPGSVTHAFDMEQRLVGLCGAAPQPPCAGSGGTLDLTSPSNGNVAPPGFYMLFLLDAAGVPSRAAFIELSPHSGAPPEGTISSPAASYVTITAGQSVSFGTSTVAPKYTWIFPGGSPPTSTAKNPGNVTFTAAGEYYVSLTVGAGNGDTDPSPATRKVRVLPPTANFEMSVSPASQTIVPGEPATFVVQVTGVKGFAGQVDLHADSEGGIPSGITIGGFDPPTVTGTGSTTLTVNTTTSAVPYALSLTIHGHAGSIEHSTSATVLVHLDAPDGLLASPSPGQVQLSWLPVTGANGYEVKRATAAEGGYQRIGCTSLTSFTDAGLTNGTTYHYQVVATHTSGPVAGGASAPAAAVVTMPPCPTPTYGGLLAAGKSDGSVLWSWTAGGAVAFDLLRGNLGTLRDTGGDFAAAVSALPESEGACLANDTALWSTADPFADPAPDAGVFTLIRPVTVACPAHGTADDGSPYLVAGRDLGIEAAVTCP